MTAGRYDDVHLWPYKPVERQLSLPARGTDFSTAVPVRRPVVGSYVQACLGKNPCNHTKQKFTNKIGADTIGTAELW